MNEISVKQLKEVLKSNSHRPVANFSFALNYYFGKYDVTGYHIVNIIIHWITGILLFIFIRKTLLINNQGYEEGLPPPPSFNLTMIPFFAAMLWLVHPLNTESVTYIVQRMNAMAAMFYLLAFICYINGRIIQRSSATKKENIYKIRYRMWFAGCFLSAVLAMGSKQNAASLPVFILIYEWFFFHELKWKWTPKRIYVTGFFLFFFLIVALIYLKVDAALLDLYSVQDFTLPQRLMTELRVVIFYISLIVFPAPYRLNLAYDYPLSFSLINPWTTLLCLIVIIGLFGFSFYIMKKDRIIFFCILWYFGNLVIESSFIGLAVIFEHRTYLPSMMICFLFVMLLFRFLKDQRVVSCLLCLLIALFSFWTHQRNNVWRDEISMWKDCIKKAPKRHWPYCSLGMAYAKKGETEKAISFIQKALEKDPDFPEALFAMGVARENQNRLREAIRYFRKALSVSPYYTRAYYELGLSLLHTGDLKGAVENFTQATLIDPGYAEAHNSLGNALSRSGRFNEAIRHYLMALKIEPDNPQFHNNLANAYIRTGKIAKGIAHYKRALQINPDYELARKNLQSILKVIQYKEEKRQIHSPPF